MEDDFELRVFLPLSLVLESVHCHGSFQMSCFTRQQQIVNEMGKETQLATLWPFIPNCQGSERRDRVWYLLGYKGLGPREEGGLGVD